MKTIPVLRASKSYFGLPPYSKKPMDWGSEITDDQYKRVMLVCADDGSKAVAMATEIVYACNNFIGLVHALDEVTPAFNMCIMLMEHEESRDMAREMVESYRALLDKIKRELSI